MGSATQRRPIRLQDRDFAVLLFLGQLGCLSIKDIRRIFWPDAKTDRSCQNRMSLLAGHGLVRKSELEVSYVGDHGGRPPALFSLTEFGGLVVERHTGSSPPRIQRKALKPLTLLHRAEIVEARLAWDEACRLADLPAPLWVHEQDRRPDVPAGAPPAAQLMLHHAYRKSGTGLTCRPDGATLTLIPNPRRPGTFIELVTWWEIDRSREGLLQIKRKLPGYRAAFARRAYLQYGWPGVSNPTVRVLWVCPSAERITSIRTAVQNDPTAGDFRFTTRSQLDPQQMLSEPIWIDPVGKQRRILGAAVSS